MEVYQQLPDTVLSELIRSRDVGIAGTRTVVVEQLVLLDQVMPEWMNEITRPRAAALACLTPLQVMVRGVVEGLPYRMFRNLTTTERFDLVRIHLLLKQRREALSRPGTTLAPGASETNAITQLLPSLSNNAVRRLVSHHYNVDLLTTSYLDHNSSTAALISGNAPVVTEADRYAQRHRFLSDHARSEMLAALYGVEDDDWRPAVMAAIHPLETVIVNLDRYSDKQLVQTLGMSVPLGVTSVRAYIETNLPEYRDVFTRGQLLVHRVEEIAAFLPQQLSNYLRRLSDRELFSILGAHVPYQNREQLLVRLRSLFSERQFFFPVSRDRAVNEENVLGEEVKDRTVFVLAFGTVLSYRLYTPEELLASFFPDNEEGIQFRFPEGPSGATFANYHIHSLRRVLPLFPSNSDCQQLMARVEEGLAHQGEWSDYERDVVRQLRRFPSAAIDEIKVFLHNLLDAGMYMRRWKGPGHPYPHSESETLTGDLPEQQVKHQIGLGMESLKRMEGPMQRFVLGLRMYRYQQGNLSHRNTPIGRTWEGVVKGTHCVRMASAELVGSSYHYLWIFFKEKVPGVRVASLDLIV